MSISSLSRGKFLLTEPWTFSLKSKPRTGHRLIVISNTQTVWLQGNMKHNSCSSVIWIQIIANECPWYFILTPIGEWWTKNPQTGNKIERHLWTQSKSEQMVLGNVRKRHLWTKVHINLILKNRKNWVLEMSWSVIFGQQNYTPAILVWAL